MREVCNAEWDDIQDRLKEKDAEIERLKHLAEERMERLKMEMQTTRLLKALCGRVADALERAPVLPPKMIEELIAELRKAAQ
jgi:molecular chaperone GrpE (heat shock protein)